MLLSPRDKVSLTLRQGRASARGCQRGWWARRRDAAVSAQAPAHSRGGGRESEGHIQKIARFLDQLATTAPGPAWVSNNPC
jgi:hypothetical protein